MNARDRVLEGLRGSFTRSIGGNMHHLAAARSLVFGDMIEARMMPDAPIDRFNGDEALQIARIYQALPFREKERIRELSLTTLDALISQERGETGAASDALRRHRARQIALEIAVELAYIRQIGADAHEDDDYRYTEEDAREDFIRMYQLAPEQIDALMNAARALADLPGVG